MSQYTTKTEILSDLNSMIEAGTLPARVIATLANALGQLEDTEKCSGCGKMSTQYRNSYGNKISRCCHKIPISEPWTKTWDSKLAVWVD